jgi:branched-chain amino acid transport system permease protein
MSRNERVSLPQTGTLLFNIAPYIFMGAILVILPPFFSSYIQSVTTRFLIFALFAMGYNLAFGYGGLLSLGHAVFFGAGGYTVAVLKLHYSSDLFFVGAPLGTLVATVMAALIGVIALRVSGIYFLLVTFALGQLVFSVAWNVKWLNTPGMQGFSGLSLPTFGIPGITLDETSFYYLVLTIFALCFCLMFRIVNSPFGHALVGIREGETRMQALGYNTWLYKYLAFVVSGAFSGVAGVLFGYYNFMISPIHLGVGTSFLPMVMAIIGGMGTLVGPAIGAAIVVFVELFASILTPERWPLILGGLFVTTIMFARRGIAVYMLLCWESLGRRYARTKS